MDACHQCNAMKKHNVENNDGQKFNAMESDFVYLWSCVRQLLNASQLFTIDILNHEIIVLLCRADSTEDWKSYSSKLTWSFQSDDLFYTRVSLIVFQIYSWRLNKTLCIWTEN